jgi:hypothetical protein
MGASVVRSNVGTGVWPRPAAGQKAIHPKQKISLKKNRMVGEDFFKSYPSFQIVIRLLFKAAYPVYSNKL